jgi:hypothetical protein
MPASSLIRITKAFIFFLVLSGPVSSALSQKYFQQDVRYNIRVTLNDIRHELSAFEAIDYINNSPDTLTFLYFHLWPNAYSDNKTDLAKQLSQSKGKQKLFIDDELRGNIDSLDFSINNKRVHWEYLPGQPDICIIRLNKNSGPGDTIRISTPFRVKIPKGVTSRLGHIEESYQISQWYPKPAVYDMNGWHQMPYLDQGEFYSEFGRFDVSITLPDNYIVGATGDLQNSEETRWLESIAADTTWKLTARYLRDVFPPSSHQMKTLRYTGDQIHDFAWFADKRFHVLKGKVKLPDSGREVTTWAMFTNQQAEIWKDALKYVNYSIEYFSKLIGDYPYNTFTAVQSSLNAGAGMEYPGITVIGLADDGYTLDEVITHEVCHNWFYGALGSDERRYPFMDEGIVSAYEVRYMKKRYPEKKLWEVYFKKPGIAKFMHIDKMPVERSAELDWLVQARQNLEQPIDLPAPDYSYANYGTMIYNKAGMGFNYLRAYLGDSKFDSTMHNYYEVWKSKHPRPDDLRNIFESTTGKDLSWFFTDFIGTTKRLDYKVARYDNNKLLVKNNGELISPVVIAGMKGDSVSFEKWSDGFRGSRWIEIPEGNYTSVRIDPMHEMPDLFRLNNNIRTSGLLRKADQTRLQFLYTIEDPDKRTLIWFPAVNWTREDGFMIGFNLHNRILLPKPVEFNLTPFYKVKDTDIAGDGKISFNITPYDNFIRLATLSLEGTQYGSPGLQNYMRTKLGIDIYLRNSNFNNFFSHKIFGYFLAASDLFQIGLKSELKTKYYTQIGYLLEKKSLVNPYSLQASIESGNTYSKISAEFRYKISYYQKNSGLDIRLFTGGMLKNNSDSPLYAFSASGRDGLEQYLFDGTFYDRFNESKKTFWSRQMTLPEGALVSPLNDSLGYSRWLVSLSFTSNLPGRAGRMPVKPFVNILLNDHGTGNGHNSPVFFEAGFKAGLWNLFEVYVPVLVSGNLSSIGGSVKDRIRFVLNLDAFNQVNLSRGQAK